MKGAAAFLKAQWGWLALIAIAAAAWGGYTLYQQRQDELARQAAAAALRVETLRVGSIRAVVSATGAVSPEMQAGLYFALPGTVAQVLVEPGDVVERGQVLARLESAQLRLAVQQAQDSLTVAQLNRQKLLAGPSEEDLDVARANLRAARIAAGDAGRGVGEEQVAIAQLRYDSLQTDYQQLADQYNGLVQFARDNPAFAPPQDTLDSLKTRMESAYFAAEIGRLQVQQLQQTGRGPAAVASAQVVQAQAVLSQTLVGATDLQLAQADLSIEQAEAGLARAELRLAQSELLAPFDGVVASVGIRAGEPAGAGAVPAVVLLDVSRFFLQINVDEVDVARLEAGQPAAVRVDALPDQPLTAVVERIAPLPVAPGGLVNYAIRLEIEAGGAPLRTGMSATAEVVVAEASDAILAPNWAIRRDRRSGQAFVSLQVDGQLVERPIVTGLRGDAYTQVLEGAAAGDVAAVSSEREGLSLLGGGP